MVATGSAEADPLFEAILSSETPFEGHFLTVRRDQVRGPDGRTAQREYIVHPGAVMIVPLCDDGSVIIERQFRHPLRRAFLEFPAGKRDAGETPLGCARRELLEETGFVAGIWTYLGSIHNAIAYSDERIDLYLARALEHRGARLDEGEHLEVLQVPWRDVLRWASDGTLSDVKTIIGIHWLEKFLDYGWLPPAEEHLVERDREDRAAKQA